MGPRPAATPSASPALVYEAGLGSNCVDADGNRYVDLAAGFGALLLGHSHPQVVRALERQASRLLQALGDVYPSDVKIELQEQIARLYGDDAQVILGQSGSDALSAAIKTATLATGRPGLVAFRGSYHGLGYGPLAACGLRPSYLEPFARQLNLNVDFVSYPHGEGWPGAIAELAEALHKRPPAAVIFEPILGRGGCVVPPAACLKPLQSVVRESGALLIADEVWTGLGRAGSWLRSREVGLTPDLVCLGKGLGGGVPVSACVGPARIMGHWSQPAEVVHTATFSGAPLACAAALATLEVLRTEGLVARADQLGDSLGDALRAALGDRADVRGAGLMWGLELRGRPGQANHLQAELLRRGYVTSTGGGSREVLVLTPALTISQQLLSGFVAELANCLQTLAE